MYTDNIHWYTVHIIDKHTGIVHRLYGACVHVCELELVAVAVVVVVRAVVGLEVEVVRVVDEGDEGNEGDLAG